MTGSGLEPALHTFSRLVFKVINEESENRLGAPHAPSNRLTSSLCLINCQLETAARDSPTIVYYFPSLFSNGSPAPAAPRGLQRSGTRLHPLQALGCKQAPKPDHPTWRYGYMASQQVMPKIALCFSKFFYHVKEESIAVQDNRALLFLPCVRQVGYAFASL